MPNSAQSIPKAPLAWTRITTEMDLIPSYSLPPAEPKLTPRQAAIAKFWASEFAQPIHRMLVKITNSVAEQARNSMEEALGQIRSIENSYPIKELWTINRLPNGQTILEEVTVLKNQLVKQHKKLLQIEQYFMHELLQNELPKHKNAQRGTSDNLH